MNHEQIEGMAAVFETVPSLTEIEVRHGTLTLRLRRGGAAPPAVSPAPITNSTQGSLAAITTPEPHQIQITSSFVGVFHALTKNPIVEGDIVTKNQVLGHTDTIHILSAIPATISGKITKIYVQENQSVEYGQPLFEISAQ
jgi:acetyl-CoA carboxylase biotin carboxyl carrier protein